MTKFREWYVRHQDAITWTVIGFLTFALIDNLAHHNWFWAAVDAVLIYINYKLRDFRLR